jgi:PAS domain-containing protein
MGLLLETRSNAAPLRDDAFLVVDSSLTVQAVSRRAQALLGVSEEEAMSQPVAQFLGAADAEAREAGEFINLLRAASAGSEEVRSLFVRPLGAFGVRVIARIVPCGPPRAALVVLGGRSARDFLYVV